MVRDGRLHRQCVIHRDIEPANLHQDEEGVLRLLDLGVALSGREPAAMRQRHAGTPSFINPEQWGRSAASSDGPEELSDLFALGVTLYQLLTSKLPSGNLEAGAGAVCAVQSAVGVLANVFAEIGIADSSTKCNVQ